MASSNSRIKRLRARDPISMASSNSRIKRLRARDSISMASSSSRIKRLCVRDPISMTSSSFTKPVDLSPSSSSQGRYDVFVREDIRKNFADHLFDALKRKGVYAFRDDKELERGKFIGPDLIKAIEGSRVCIVIFSEAYASSTWCLDELVKIMECKRELDRVVLPVFYKVDPSDVRKQRGSFNEAFSKHEEAFMVDLEKVKRWRAAMTQVCDLSGFHLQDRHETDFIQDIVKDTLSKLKPESSSAAGEFVGMNQRLRELHHYIDLGCDDVRFIGIHGMGGIGKTTLAEVAYQQISNSFDASCFLGDVRENSEKNQLVSLQEKILSQILKDSSFRVSNARDGMIMIKCRLQHLKVLLVIDDVDHVDQLTHLVGNFDWFGSGSRIIVTTRDEHVLVAHGIDKIYKVGSLNDNEALQILSLKAFKAKNPPADYVELCENVIRYCDNLPLALKVVGSFLFGRSKDSWNSALERLREDSEKEVIDRLRISYDGLTEREKPIFLDIAFFFNGCSKLLLEAIFDSCGFHPKIGMEVLIERCLIFISDHKIVLMHDLLQEMAKKIVQSESIKEPGKRSRLWQGDKAAANVLMKNMGTETVEGISHRFPPADKNELNPQAFARMNNLRVLMIWHAKLPRGLAYLPNDLRYLSWESYPLKSLPSNFEPENIVLLELVKSNVIRQLWKGTKVLNKLKALVLNDCWKLTTTPDFTYIPNLESLSLRRCNSLSKVHPSIGYLRKLRELYLSDCTNLVSLPDFISLESLGICNLDGCSKLKNFPKIMGEMKSLEQVDISGTAIKDIPSSKFLLMKNLALLWCQGCKGMSRRLLSLSGLPSLTWLNLDYCNLGEGDIPSDLGCLSSLQFLDLSGNCFVNLPTSINQLSSLLILYLEDCKRLKSLPELPSLFAHTYVLVRGCTLLESSTKHPSFLPFRFNGMHCYKLVEKEGGSNLAFAIMKRYFQSFIFLTWSPSVCFRSGSIIWPIMVKEEPSYVNVVLPGREIPEWFSVQSEGNSMTLENPTQYSPDSNVLLGYAMCCVLSTQKTLSVSNIFFYVTVNDSFKWEIPMKGKFSDHIWLSFFPIKFLESHGLRDCDQTKVKFESELVGDVVKQCAIRKVYEQDVKEFNDMSKESVK